MATLPTSSALLEPVLAPSRKRRYSALDFLSINPDTSNLDHAKRPRILVLDEDSEGAAGHASLDFPQGSATTAEAVGSSSSTIEDSGDDSTSSSGSSSEEGESDQADSSSVEEGSLLGRAQSGSEGVTNDEGTTDAHESATSTSSSSSDESDNNASCSTPTPGASVHELTPHFRSTPQPSHRQTHARFNSTASSRGSSRSPIRPAPGSLHSRLKTFLPQLHAANAHLDTLRDAGRLEAHRVEIDDDNPVEHVDGEKDGDADDEGEDGAVPQYIEMNLGLGVLEGRQGRADESDSESSESSASSTPGEKEDERGGVPLSEEVPGRKEQQVLRKLMGYKRVPRPEIKIVDEAAEK